MQSTLGDFPSSIIAFGQSSGFDLIENDSTQAIDMGVVGELETTNSKRKIVGEQSRSCMGKKLRVDENGLGNSIQLLWTGEVVKNANKVVQMRKDNRKRQPNINCRVEAYGRVICEFDDVRRRWVVEMGFGGLLNIVGLTLPRMLCYWLMTRLDPINESIRFSDGKEFILTPNHVRWVLGLPNGGKDLPRKVVTEEMRTKVETIRDKFGVDCLGTFKRSGKEIYSKGLMVTDEVIERLKGEWKSGEEEEFKMLFLLFSLYMILCPTQSRCLEADLVPSLTCALDVGTYDWCGLVMQKLMGSVKRFARKFDAAGYAGGCGGCALFVAAISEANKVGVWSRVQVWNAAELRRASQEDRLVDGGDYGKLKSLNAAYGELHPLDGGDKCAPDGDCGESVPVFVNHGVRKRRRGRKAAPLKVD